MEVKSVVIAPRLHCTVKYHVGNRIGSKDDCWVYLENGTVFIFKNQDDIVPHVILSLVNTEITIINQ